MTTQIDYKKLRSKLPRGYGKTLAERTNKSESAVYKVLSGELSSITILNEALNLAKEHANNNNNIATEINNL